MKKNIITLLISCLLISSIFITNVGAVFTNSTSINSNYNRANAKTYIERWVDTNNPAYENLAYSGGPGDCTNFASQVVRAGGMSFYPGYKLSSPDTRHWYYYGAGYPNRTATWTSAHNFRQYWADVNGSGQKKAYKFKKYTVKQVGESMDAYNDIFYNVKAGDIIQYVHAENGLTYHSQVVHRTSIVVSGTTNIHKVSMAQHSTAGNYGWMTFASKINYLYYHGGINDWVCVIRIKEGK